MKRIFTTMLLCCLAAAFLQAQPVTLTFTGCDANNQYLPLTRVVVSNLTKNWHETLMWPDTVLVMSGTGIEDLETQNFVSLRLSQNNPNPFDGTTFVNLQMVEPGDVAIEITDITGRIVETLRATSLQPGIHEMRITLSTAGIFFLTARQNGRSASVKMVNRGNGGDNAITISGVVETLRATSLPHPKADHRSATDNPFDAGDRMEYVGYAVINGEEVGSNHVVQLQEVSQTIVLSFPQPCPGAATVTDYDGNVYNTVQMGDQCWMRENLRVTHYSDGTPIPAGGENYWSYTEPYYYDYSSSSIPLVERGYLYNWPAAMHGTASSDSLPSGVQGVCPTGWHLPSSAEWGALDDYVGANYACEVTVHVARALASKVWWESSDVSCSPGYNVTANNTSGFGAVPAGYYLSDGFNYAGYSARFWSSFEGCIEASYICSLDYDDSIMHKGYAYMKYIGFSVRCLRD